MISLSLNHLLESLPLNLSLSGGDGLLGVGVIKTAALLVILESRSFGGADTKALAVVGAASGRAISIADATSGDELRTITGTNVPGTGVVWGDNSKGRNGDCKHES